ncbi:hypothetical protein BLA60_05925 [Actinophytocola xinjiangensis]|uniref:Transcriptional regulator LacI/GalR-like sensor domain-containing protein n=1 Tax=Actinophytocola xinjiangensis TaxID=485602 RepID=A0A7Z0WQV7_9PSEU|nr:substrate-binding domain-containing protein [Actinophytocola xinjiangensis]OLF12806.1 hypothetical protein BLA60_05925 [Actinophytocola xinjiangensis]
MVRSSCPTLGRSRCRDLDIAVVSRSEPVARFQDLSILADDAGGARLAVEHLLSLDRRRIAHITGPAGYRAARDRVTALCAVLAEAGLSLAGEPCTASGPRAGAGVTQALTDCGKRIPDDIAVVGYDNGENFADGRTLSRQPPRMASSTRAAASAWPRALGCT